MSSIVAEEVMIKVERYYLNGEKTCAASFKPNSSKVCPMLLSVRFGTQLHCGAGMVEIDFETLKPHSDCIVWRDTQ